jgi:putative peptide zinc metalloprotease protein
MVMNQPGRGLGERHPFRTTHNWRKKIVGHAPVIATSTPVPMLDAQLLGRYESSGMADERYLVRRRDGQVILLTLILYTIASKLDGHQDLEHVAADVSERIGKPVAPEVITEVIDTRLRPLGIIQSEELVPPVPHVRADPLLRLSLRGTLLPARAVRTIARYFCPLYWSLVVLVALEALVAADIWMFAVHGVSNSFSDLTSKPLLFLPVIGVVVGGSLFHEIGHATACKFGGGEPGRIGYGIMVIFPAFYTDCTDAYRLGREARVRTDLGGVYFNALFIVALTGIYAATGYLPLVAAIVIIHLNVVQQMLPLIRLDGYYLLSDLVGVPDLFARIGPMFRLRDKRSRQLQPHARRIVTAWVMIVVPALLFCLGLFIWHLPHFVYSTWHSAQVQWTIAYWSMRGRHYQAATLAALSMVFLAIPILGITVLTMRILRKLIRRKPHQGKKGEPCVQQDEEVERPEARLGRDAHVGPSYRFRTSGQRFQHDQPGIGRYATGTQDERADQLSSQQRGSWQYGRRLEPGPGHQLLLRRLQDCRGGGPD